MDELHAKKIERYAAGPGALRQAWARVPASAIDRRPEVGKWSAREVLAHCADAEMNASSRIRYVIGEDEPTIQGYDQDRWAVRLGYAAAEPAACWAMIEATRAWTLPLLRSLEPAAWSRRAQHTEIGSYGAEEWLTIYSEHLHQHARQLERIARGATPGP